MHGSTEKLIGWPIYSYRIWPIDFYIPSTVLAACPVVKAGCKNYRQKVNGLLNSKNRRENLFLNGHFCGVGGNLKASKTKFLAFHHQCSDPHLVPIDMNSSSWRSTLLQQTFRTDLHCWPKIENLHQICCQGQCKNCCIILLLQKVSHFQCNPLPV